MIRIRPELNCMEQNSGVLLEALQNEYLRPPSDQVFKVWRPLLLSATCSMNIQGYNRTMIPSPSPSNKSSYFFSQYSQDQFLDRHIFKGRLEVTKKVSLKCQSSKLLQQRHMFVLFQGGFFVESGSTDGVQHSNSLVFAKNMACWPKINIKKGNERDL